MIHFRKHNESQRSSIFYHAKRGGEREKKKDIEAEKDYAFFGGEGALISTIKKNI
jgi:hypothetical protein